VREGQRHHRCRDRRAGAYESTSAAHHQDADGSGSGLVLAITRDRHTGRAAPVAGDLDTAFTNCSAHLPPGLDHVRAIAREVVPREWELETDLTPPARCARARSRGRPMPGDVFSTIARRARFRRGGQVARARRAWFEASQGRPAHAARWQPLSRRVETETFLSGYSGLGSTRARVGQYLSATRLDLCSARPIPAIRSPIACIRQDPLAAASTIRPTDARITSSEALNHARDLAQQTIRAG
jgi:hypothetical protein